MHILHTMWSYRKKISWVQSVCLHLISELKPMKHRLMVRMFMFYSWYIAKVQHNTHLVGTHNPCCQWVWPTPLKFHDPLINWWGILRPLMNGDGYWISTVGKKLVAPIITNYFVIIEGSSPSIEYLVILNKLCTSPKWKHHFC